MEAFVLILSEKGLFEGNTANISIFVLGRACPKKTWPYGRKAIGALRDS